MFPKQFADRFKAVGIKIGDYLVPMDREFHKIIHGKGGIVEFERTWNKRLEKWRLNNPGAKANDMKRFMSSLRKEFGF